MKNRVYFPKFRSFLLVLVSILIFGAYFLQLLQIQVVDAQQYQEMVQGRTISTQYVKAMRGEIVDRNGIPLVQNAMSYDVIIDKAFFPYDKQNETILNLVELFDNSGVAWIDNLPITKTQPFEYIADMENEVLALQTKKNAHSYTTAEDLMFWLIQEYKLEDYSKEDARNIISVRYEMERKDFSTRIPYTFAKDITPEMIITVKEYSYELPGIDVVSSGVRIYPDDTLAPHMLGLVGPLYKEEYDKLKDQGLILNPATGEFSTRGYSMDDIIGKSGIEKAMEDYLRGDNGLKEIQVDSSGKVVAVEESITPVPGGTVYLTIDAEMQRLLEEALEAQIKHLNETQPAGRGGEAHSGAAVVLNPKTGEILAAATYPSYSIADYKSNYSEVESRSGKPLINRAIVGQYTPGSIFKPAVALAGLGSGTITEHTIFNCTGTYGFFAPSYTPKCLSTHGPISVNNAIAWSCNIFFYETGRLTGIDNLDNMSKMLGLGEPTGIEIEEGLGQRSNPEIKAARGGGEWYGADTIQTAIGQFDNRFTPLQLANYAATIANRGTRMKLTLVNKVEDYYMRETIKPFEPEVAYTITDASPEDFETTIKGMISATTGSSSGTFSGYPIEVASKTGTPQVTEDVVNSTFIAFAPADDPQLAIAVVIEEGWQGYTCAPVAKAVFDDYFGIDHRGAVASGPQRLEDYRNSNVTLGTSVDPNMRDMDAVFPDYVDGIPEK